MTYLEAQDLAKIKNQEFIDYCMNHDIESVYGLSTEEENTLKQKFNQANVFNINIAVHQNYRIVDLNSGLYFVPYGLLTGDISLITQMPVPDNILKDNNWTISSKNITNIDW